MLHLDIKVVDSVEVRLAIQVISFLIALIVTQMVWREFRRNKTDFLKYLTASFSVILVQSAFMLSVFIYSLLTDNKLPEAFMPMIDHILKVIGYFLLAYTFTTVTPIDKDKAKSGFKLIAITTLAAIPILWYYWLQYLASAPPNAQKFGYYWIDPLFEAWITTGLIVGIYLVSISTVKMRNAFLLSFMIIIIKQLMHLINILLSQNTIPWMLVIERLLLIPYFYVLIVAIHREIVDEIRSVNTEKESLNRQLYDSTIQALVSSLEIKDRYTQGHATRVTNLAILIGKRLGLEHEELRNLYYGAILHDIGKIGVHEDILNKPGKLDEQEHLIIRKHPIDGTQIIHGLNNLRHISETIRHHHERWDGKGYPDGLKENAIPLHARIIAIADSFDAMTSNRAYRRALSTHEAFEELITCRGTQFDPQLIDLFVELIDSEIMSSTDWEVAASLNK